MRPPTSDAVQRGLAPVRVAAASDPRAVLVEQICIIRRILGR
ncbi:hypothetical protein HMPREF1868_01671 [Olsenella sp. DNF00959]|nr:hypothetical protein HMPREF1868_01671 [Olsenella sp. DNF00959]